MAKKKLQFKYYFLNNSTGFSTFSHFSSLISRILRRSGNARHHDGDDVLVDSQDVDQIRMLEENVIVHKSPLENSYFEYFEKRNEVHEIEIIIEKLFWITWCQFRQHFTSSFCSKRSQKCKKTLLRIYKK